MMRLIAIFSLSLLILSCSSSDNTVANTGSETPDAMENQASVEQDQSANAVRVNQSVSSEPEIVAVNAQTKQAVAPNSQLKPQPANSSSKATIKPNVVLSDNSTTVSEQKKTGPTIIENQPNTSVSKQGVVVIEEESVAAPKSKPDHSIWEVFLRTYVSGIGQVNYRSIKNNPGELDRYLAELAQYAPQSDWTRNEIMAFWINAYNANTIKLIINNYPIASIKDIGDGNPWATKWIKIGGESYSLNQIENDILRARYGDARIHFAVNCAAASCPPLYNRAFTAANLDHSLQLLTRKFINNTSYNTLDERSIEISKIFEWYAGDFGSVKDYINGFTSVEIGANTRVSYKEYDWRLNGK